MKVEPGKYYRLRDGRVRGPVRTCSPDKELFTDEVYHWRADGRQFGVMTSDDMPTDIVSEAPAPIEKPEPRRVRFVQFEMLPSGSGIAALDDAGYLWILLQNTAKWTRIEGPEVSS